MKNKKFLLILLCSLLTLISFSQQYEEQPGISLTGINQGSSAWGDINNDGDLDILLCGWDGLSPVAKLYVNNGDNTFSLSGASLTGVFLSSAVFGDFDNDHDQDILISGTTSPATPTAGAITKVYKNNGSGSFSEVATGLPGVYYASVSWCDYNRDGKADILLTGMSDGAERICKLYRNSGSFSFTEVKGTPFIGFQYGSHVWGDFDKDGYDDLIISGQNAAQERDTRFYHNNGDGTFREIENHPFQKVYYSSVAAADYNGDGLLDILLAGEATSSSITRLYKNLGSNNFTEVTTVSLTGVSKCSVRMADYNDDGKPDIFIAGYSSGGRIFKVYNNCGNDAFCSSAEVLPGIQECSISIADYDNDSAKDPDILLTGKDVTANLISRVFRNNCLTSNSIPPAPTGLSYVTAGTTAILNWTKIAGDETPVNSMFYNVRIERTGLKPAFVSANSTNAGLRKTEGFGNAGMNDFFIFKNLRWDTTYNASVQAIDNSYTGGAFSSVSPLMITPVQPSNLVANYNTIVSINVSWTRGNGDKCIVFAKEGSTGSASPVDNTTYYANSVFGEGSPLGAGWYCVYKGEADSVTITGLETQKDYSVHVIEYQGQNGSENYADAIADNVAVFSTGLFTNQAGAGMTGLRYSSVSWGDFNNDRYLDAMITGLNLAGEGVTKIYQNNANNTFTELAGLTIPGVYHSSVSWGDYNNDGFLDVLVTGLNDALGPISKVFKNNGNSTFSEQTGIILSGVYNSSAVWGDYDNDGDLDIIIAGQALDGSVSTSVYRNEGSNVFSLQAGIVLPGLRNGSLALGDYDGDGYLDVILTGFSNSNIRITRIYRNSGNNSFEYQNGIVLPVASLSSVSWGDFDNDGRLDIALAGATGDYPAFNPFTRIFRNNGDNIFTQVSNTNMVGISQGTIAWGDYNNDGFLDLFVTGHTGTSYITKIYHNNGDKTFTDNPFVEIPGFIGCDAKWADYDNDGDLDILISGYTGALTSRVYKNNSYMFPGDIKANNKPPTPGGLHSTVVPGTVSLFWDPVSGDETPEVNMSYNVRCKLDGTENWYYSPQSLDNGNRSLVSIGNVQLNKSFSIKNPNSGQYYWQVQAVDQGFQGSSWSSLETFLVKKTQAYFTFDEVCFGTSTTFTDGSVVFDGAVGWKWDFGDGNTSVVKNPSHKFAANGTYNVKLVVTGTSGTKDSLVRQVIVKSSPKASFTAPNTCIGLPSIFTNNTVLNGLTADRWVWKFGDSQTSSLQNPGTHNYALTGVYKVILKITSTNGCSDSILQDVIVAKYPETAISVAGDFSTVDGKLTFCDSQSLLLNATNDLLYTYQWRKDGNDLSGSAGYSFSVRNSGLYTATITNTLANCVTVSESKNVNVKPSPTKPVVISDNYKTGDCVKENPVKLKVEQTVNEYSYSWLRNGTPINNANSPFIEDFLVQGDYVVSAALNGCSVNSEKFSVAYQGAPEKPVVYAQGPIKWYLACNNLDPEARYLWYFNGKLINGAVKYYYVADQNLGVYQVRVGDSKGCFTTSDSIRIPLDKYSPELKSFHNEDPFLGLKIYPNPSNGIFNIMMDNELNGNMDISIITQGGKEIYKKTLEKATIHFIGTIDLSGQTRGIYLVKMRMNDSFTTNQIIVE